MKEQIIQVSDTQRIVVKSHGYRPTKEYYPEEFKRGLFVTKWRPAGYRQLLSLCSSLEPLYLFSEHEARLWLEHGENYQRYIDGDELMKEIERDEQERLTNSKKPRLD